MSLNATKGAILHAISYTQNDALEQVKQLVFGMRDVSQTR